MKSKTVPVALPSGLIGEIRKTAKETGLSLADAMCQSLKLGLPRLRERLVAGKVTNVAPLPARVARKLYADPEDDAQSIRLFMAAQAKVIEE